MTLTTEQAEYFRTPPWPIRRLLEHPAVARLLPQWQRGAWCDPCVGEGAIVDAVESRLDTLCWWGCDIRPTEWMALRRAHGRPHISDFPSAWQIHDYLACSPPDCDVAIFNPPFTKALQFAAKAIQHCRHVFMLQRRNWLASALRLDREWIERNPPAEFLLEERISFINGTTDNQEYEWYCWSPHFRGLYFLAPTSAEERKQTLRVRSAQASLFGDEADAALQPETCR